MQSHCFAIRINYLLFDLVSRKRKSYYPFVGETEEIFRLLEIQPFNFGLPNMVTRMSENDGRLDIGYVQDYHVELVAVNLFVANDQLFAIFTIIKVS